MAGNRDGSTRKQYLHFKNAHFMLGGLTSVGIGILEEGMRGWDKDTGIPSRIISHNAVSTAPFESADCTAGVVSEYGKGSYFTATEVKPTGAPRLQMHMPTRPGDTETVLEIPMRLVLKGARDVTKGHTVYLHVVTDRDGHSFSYYGITSRHWLKRFREHLDKASTGSPYLFHQALSRGKSAISRLTHVIVAVGLDKDQAYDLEEYLFAKHSLYPNVPTGLNMIPGGYEGMRCLHALGVLAERGEPSPDERAAIIEEHLRMTKSAPRRPNPLVAAMWEDDEYAEAVICGRENRFSADQVRLIRFLHVEGRPVTQIAAALDCPDLPRLNRVIRRRTYGRVRDLDPSADNLTGSGDPNTSDIESTAT
jgi:hypothetical protein